jgi:hypothetical protein
MSGAILSSLTVRLLRLAAVMFSIGPPDYDCRLSADDHWLSNIEKSF